ncbi:hypothetical protein OROHE_007059 [Orobanche hederae]
MWHGFCPQNGSVWYFSSKLDIPSNVLQKKRVAHILVFKIRPSQDILKIRDDPFGGGRNFDIQKKALEMDRDVPSKVLQKKRVVRILVFKIRSSQEIHKIRDGTPLEVEEILTYIKKPRNGSFGTFLASYMSLVMYYRRKEWHGIWFSKLDHLKKFSKFVMIPIWRVARILVFKIRPYQEILKIRDGTIHLECKLDVPSKVLQKKRVARILVFKIRPSQDILKIRDGTPLEAEEILTYRKSPQNGSVWYFSSKLDIPSNVLQKKRVAHILVFKIRPSQDILKIRDGTPLEAEEILTYRKKPSKWIVMSSQEIHKIRDGTPLEVEEILTYIKKPRNGSFGTFLASYMSLVMYYRRKEWHGFWFSKLDHLKKFSKFVMIPIWRPSQDILKIRDGTPLENKRVARILVFKIRPSQEILKIRDVARILVFKIRPYQEILKIRDGTTPLENKRVARILVFKIRPSQEILKIRDGTTLEKKRVARILVFKIWPSQEILKIRDGTLWSKLDIPSNVLQKKRVAHILVFKIRPSQDILKIRDDPFGGGRNFDIQKKALEMDRLDVPSKVLQKKRVVRILVFKIRSSQEIHKIRDGTPLEVEEILTYIKKPRNGSFVARILFFKIWPSQEILKIRDDVPSKVLQKKRVVRILVFKIRSSQEIHKIRDGTPLEVEEILTYIKKPRNGSFGTFLASYMSLVMYYRRKEWHGIWFSKLDHLKKFSKFKKRVARILVFKIRPYQEILKIRDGTIHLEKKRVLDVPSNVLQKKTVARILFFKIWPSQKILKIRDGTPLEAEEILTYRKSPQNGSVWYFSSMLDIPSNVLQKKRVEHILVFKIRPSQEILKIRDGTPLEKKTVARILFFKIWPSQKILKIRDGTPLEAEEILTYRKSPQNGSVWYFSSMLDIPSNVLQKKRVEHILVFKIRPSQDILKIRDGTPLEAEEILTYRKKPSKWIVLQKKRVVRILVFKIRSSQEIHKIRDGTPLEVEEILTYIKKPRNGSFGTFLASYMSLVMYYRRKEWHGFWFSKLDHLKKFSKFVMVPLWRPYQEILKIRDDVPSNVLQKKRVARILFFKIWPSQKILKIRDGTPLEAEEILTYRKSPQNGSVWYFSSKLDIPSNVLQKKRVAHILVFKIRPSQDILKIRDGTPLEAEEILTYRKKPSKWIDKVLQKKRVVRILVFKIRSTQEIHKIRDGTPLEVEEILTYIKKPRNGSFGTFLASYMSLVMYYRRKEWHGFWFSKLDHLKKFSKFKKRVAHILVFKIRPSQDILKIRDDPFGGGRNFDIQKKALEMDRKKRVVRILVFKIRSSQEIHKIRDGTPLEVEEILTYIKKPRNGSKKRVVRILVFKIRSSQEIHKIRDGTPLEVEEILTYIKKPRNGSFGTFLASYMSLVMYYRRKEWHGIWFSKLDHLKKFSKFKKTVARILFFKIWPSQKILKIRDGTPLEAEEILTYRKSPQNGSVWYFSSMLDIPSNVLQKKRVEHILVFKIRPSQEILKIRDGTPLEKKTVARILFFKIWPSQKILKIRDGTPLEAEEILTYRKSPQNGSVWYFSSMLDIPSNVLQKKRVEHILVFKIRPSQDILKIRDGTPLEAEEILTYRKKPSKWIDVPSNVLQKKTVARILFFKIWPSQKILKIRDGTPLEAEEILTYRKSPQNGSVWYFSSMLDIPSNVLQKKRVEHILVFKIRPSQDILKIRDGTPLEAEEILTYRKKPSKWIDVPSKVLQKKRVVRILVFKIRSSQEIHKIRDGTPLEVEEILTYIKKPRNGSFGTFLASYMSLVMYYRRKEWHGFWFSKLDHLKKFSKFVMVPLWRPYQEILKIRDDVPSNVLQKKRVARILFFKIWPSQKILKIRDGTPLEAEEILTYRKSPQNGSVWYFSSKLDIPSNVLQKKRVAHILVFKIRPSQDILKIRDGTPLEAEEILTYRKKPSKWIVKRVVRILVFKIRSTQEIHKIRDGTPLEVEEILTYIKKPRNGSFGTFLASYMSLVMYYRRKEWHGFWFSKLDHLKKFSKFKKRVARILVFKIRPYQEILKIRDDVPSNVLQKKRVARILFFKIWPSQKILKIRDGTPLEAEEILTYRKSPQNGSVWYFSSKLDIPSNVLQKKRVAHILVFKIRPSQDILKIRDGTPLEAEEILTYRKKPSKWIVLQKKRVVRILVFKIRSSQEIHKIRDGTPLEVEEILTYIKKPRNGSFGTFLASYMSLVMYYRRKEWHGFWFSKLDHLKKFSKFKKRVARILVFKIRPYQEILKIRDGTIHLEKKRVARILFFKIWPSQDILKIRDGTPLEKKRVVRILVFKIRSSQEIHKIRDGTPLEVEEILTYIKKPRNGSFGTFLASYMSLVMYYRRKEWHGFWFSKLDHLKKFSKFVMVPLWRPYQEILKIRDDVPSNVLQKKRVARILFFKIWPSQKILKIRDGTPLEAEEILTYRKSPQNGSVWYFSSKLDIPSNVLQKKRVAHILVFKIRPSQDILKIRDGTPLEAEEILTYRKKPSKWIDVPSKVLQKKRVVRILVFKIRSSQEIHKIRDGTPLELDCKVLQKKRVVRILVFKIRSSQEIHKIRDGTPLEVEEILTYIKKPRNGSFGTFLASYMSLVMYYRRKEWHGIWFSKLDHLKKFSKFVMIPIWRKKTVARILFFKIWPSQKILKIRDGTPLEAEEILTYRKSPQNGSVWYFSSMLDIPSNVLQKKRVEHILVFKIRPSQDILKIRDGTPLEAEEILTYRKKPSKWIDVPSNVLQKKTVARILFFKIWPSQKILKIRDGTPLEAEEILTYRKSPQNGSVWYFSSMLDIPSNVLQKKRVEHILVFKIRPSQEILKIRDGTPLELDVPSNVLQKKTVARILFFKIWPSQKILKIRDGTPLEAEEILTYRKSPQNGSVWYFSSMLDIPSNVLQKKRVEHILVFKIRPSQDILKIRDGTPLEAEEILTYRKKPSKWIVLQKKRVVRILVFKIRSSQEIHKIRDGTPLEVEEILTYIKKPRNGSFGTFLASYMSLVMYYRRKEWHGFWFSKLDHLKKFSKFVMKRVARILVFKIRPYQEILKIRDDVPSNVLQKKRVARILFFKIWPSQKILKIRDGTPLEAEEILTYRKSPQNGSVWYFSSKLDIPSNVLQKKRVAHILVFKIRPSQDILKIRDGTPLENKRMSTQEIHKIRDGTPLEVEEILTYIKKPRNGSFGTFLASYMSLVMYYRRKEWHGFWFSKLDHLKKFSKFKKRVARILVFKIRPYQEILKIRDDVPSNVLQKKRVARILFFKIWPSQKILKIRDGTPLEAEEILTYRKSPQNGSVWYFSSKLDIPSNVLQKKRVAHILVFKIRPSQDILKIRDGTPLEAEEILTYRKKPSKWIESSQEIHKIRDGTPLEVEEILTYIKKPRNGSFGTFLASYMSLVMYYRRKEWHGFWFSKLDHLKKFSKFKRVARILVFKIRPYQEILKIRDDKLDVPGKVLQKKRVARILVFKIRPSQDILKIRDGTPLEAEEILTYRKSPQNGSVWYFSSKLDILSNVLQKKRVAHILVFKIRPSQDILKIRDGTPLEAEEILTYRKKPSKWIVLQKKRVVRILVFKIRSSQEIHKIRDGTPLEVEEILTYIKKPRNGSFGTFLASYMSLVMYYRRKEWHGFWFSKLDHLKKFSKFVMIPIWRVARILVFKIRPYQEILKIRDVARILVFKIRPSQDILKIRDGTPLEKKRVVRILVFKIRSTQEIHKIRDDTPLEVEEILTYIKKPRNGSFGTFLASYMSLVMYYRRKEWHGFWFSKLDHLKKFSKFKKRVARILVFKIRPYQEILKIRDDVPSNVLQKKRVARILFFKIWPSQKILKIRDGTPLEAEEILTYRKSPQNGSVWYFSSKLDIPSNVLQKKRVAHILVFKIRPSQDILKIRDGTPLEAEEILTYRKKPSKWIVLQKKRVVRILVFKIRSSQEIHKIRDGTPLEVEEILTYIKKPRNGSFGTFLASYMSLVMYYRRKEWHGFWFSKLDHLKKFSKFVMIPIWS